MSKRIKNEEKIVEKSRRVDAGVDNEEDDDEEDDEDYVPDKNVESDDNDDPGDDLDESSASEGDEKSTKAKKRKSTKNRKREEIEPAEEEDEEISSEKKAKLEEAKKKKADELWSSFLSDVNAPEKATPKTEPNKANIKTSTESTSSLVNHNKDEHNVKSKLGEVLSSSAVAKPSITETSTVLPKTPAVGFKTAINSTNKGPSTSAAKPKGLAGILDKINKQPKINTLEKSRQDWTEFKKQEQLEEELMGHSKGKDSYLERKAFLERADLRQFEIEKELRNKQRKLNSRENQS